MSDLKAILILLSAIVLLAVSVWSVALANSGLVVLLSDKADTNTVAPLTAKARKVWVYDDWRPTDTRF